MPSIRGIYVYRNVLSLTFYGSPWFYIYINIYDLRCQERKKERKRKGNKEDNRPRHIAILYIHVMLSSLMFIHIHKPHVSCHINIVSGHAAIYHMLCS